MVTAVYLGISKKICAVLGLPDRLHVELLQYDGPYADAGDANAITPVTAAAAAAAAAVRVRRIRFGLSGTTERKVPVE
jgi:hypothetical protein